MKYKFIVLKPFLITTINNKSEAYFTIEDCATDKFKENIFKFIEFMNEMFPDLIPQLIERGYIIPLSQYRENRINEILND